MMYIHRANMIWKFSSPFSETIFNYLPIKWSMHTVPSRISPPTLLFVTTSYWTTKIIQSVKLIKDTKQYLYNATNIRWITVNDICYNVSILNENVRVISVLILSVQNQNRNDIKSQ